MKLSIFLSLKIWILGTEIGLEIEDVFKFDSLEASKRKKATVGWLAQPLNSHKFKFSSSRKEKVHLFEVMKKASVLSEKKPPLDGG